MTDSKPREIKINGLQGRSDGWIDNKFTERVVCPYCAHVHNDTWDMDIFEDGNETECWECGKLFWARKNITITYSTNKIEGYDD